MNRTKNRINFKIKTGYKLELLSLGTIKLLGSTKQVIDKGQKTVNTPKLELIEIVLMHCNAAKKWLSSSIKSSIYIYVNWKVWTINSSDKYSDLMEF